MNGERVTVVSIDGVAPRFITPETMPNLCRLAREGGSCFTASTVFPSITLPAHTSMLRGVDPTVHGAVDNSPLPLSDEWPSFLYAARKSGLTTAALLNWKPIANIVENDALDIRYFLNSGYGRSDDDRIADAAATVLGECPDVAFAYLVSPDLAGHDGGWGSGSYLAALTHSDRALGRILDAVDDSAVLVTTDHGGHGHDHEESEAEDLETFMVIKASGIAPRSHLPTASILDVAPTVASLAGFDAPVAWSGRSLLGTEVPFVDHLLGLVEQMAHHSYGERVNMAQHSLQTAAAAAAAESHDELVIAALLHDVGHLMGEVGPWGLPDHAREGARHLQQILPPGVVEPIRLHVDAKRYLVATDPSYAAELSEASKESLAEQGGPFSQAECAEFAAGPWFEEAIALRRFDDSGKLPDLEVSDASLYRPLIERLLVQLPTSARWMRDACACPECRDPSSGQHLLSARDLEGWTRVGHRTIRHDDGRVHEIRPADRETSGLTTHHWG
ncbi:MAG: alkaline phosphatase family protein, partial [Acidimicrobiales bacterium]